MDYYDEIWHRKRGMYFDRSGSEITLRQWVELFEDLDYRHVAADTVDDAWVSTCWMGLNHAFRPTETPLIFETMVFGGPLAGDQRRYTNLQDAKDGHAAILEDVRQAAVANYSRPADRNLLEQLADVLEADTDG